MSEECAKPHHGLSKKSMASASLVEAGPESLRLEGEPLSPL
jgi:hypothetical protein